MKLVAKCLAFVSLSNQVHVKVCNPIPLIRSYMYKNLDRIGNKKFNFYSVCVVNRSD